MNVREVYAELFSVEETLDRCMRRMTSTEQAERKVERLHERAQSTVRVWGHLALLDEERRLEAWKKHALVQPSQ